MSCDDARELFSALLDETLTREERADVYGHLATCADCRRELAAIERTVALVRSASPVSAPAGFVDRVLEATRPAPWYARVARALVQPWPVKVPLGAAAVVLIAGLALLLFRGSQEQQRTSRYEATAPVLADRRLGEAPATTEAPVKSPAEAPAQPPTEAPAAPPPSPPAGASSDRTAAVASRIDQAETRAEPEKDKRDSAQSPPPAAVDTLAKREAPLAKAAATPEVIGRLAAPDRDAAERALAALTARLSGTVAGRRVEGDTPVIELVIPRERYADFTREAARFGVFRVESETTPPADVVRIAVYLTSS